MRALVIGGTGFIGLHLVDALLAAGADVRVTRRKQSVTLLVRKRPVTLVDASLEDPIALARAMEGCDVVFLAGGYYPRYSLDLRESVACGTRGVRNACNAALDVGVPRFVYTSSITTLARAPAGRDADERDVLASMPKESVYRATKWAMEREVESARRSGLSAVALLPGGCIGPGDLRVGTGSVMVGVVRGWLPWSVEGTVNLVDVEEVARAHVAAIEPRPMHRYCLGGHTLRVSTLLRAIADRYGGTLPAVELSADRARARALEDERRASPTKGRVPIPRELVDMATTGQRVSNDAARRDLGFTLAPIEHSFDAAYEWFARFGIIPSADSARKQEGTMNEHP